MATDAPNKQPTCKSLEEVLDALRLVSPGAAEYLHLYLGMFEEWESRGVSLSQLSYCFSDSLGDDQSELVGYLLAIDPEEQAAQIVDDLFLSLKDRPILLWGLEFLRHFFPERATQSGVMVMNKQNEAPSLPKYWMDNIKWSQTQQEAFFRAMDFEELGGGGDHLKWFDPVTRLPFMVSGSPVLWCKNVIRECLVKGIPLTRIKKALDKLKIEFKILSE